MPISEDKIQEIRERADIVAVVSRRVQLKKAGRSYKGLCPFHGENTPSFHVNPERKIFHCFGCNKGGDVFRFLMEIDGRPFPEVVKLLAEETGVIVDDDRDPAAARLAAHRKALAEVNARALEIFERFLWGEKGQAGRAHLAERGIDEATARAFGLGYAPAEWNALGNALRDAKLAAEAGLLIEKAGGSSYDRFRGRLMVPIQTPDGKTVAFGGRFIEELPGHKGEDKPAKYINSPETPLYEKGKVLFALDRAREAIRRAERAVLVEGYFDAIALHQAGVATAVASCGTALTGAHLELLRRTGARDVVLLFDGDEAGLRAAGRSAQMAAETHMSAKVALLPKGDDPDTFVRREGAAAVENLVVSAPAALEHLIDRALAASGPSVEDKVRTIEAVKPWLAAAPPGLTRDLYVEKVARRLNVSARAVTGVLHGEKRSGAARGKPPPTPAGPPPPPADEVFVAALVLRHPELAAGAAAKAASFAHGAMRAVVEHVADCYEQGKAVDAAAEASAVEEEKARGLLVKVLLDEGSIPAEIPAGELLAQPLWRIEWNALVRRQREVQAEMQAAQAGGRDTTPLAQETVRLTAEKKRLAQSDPSKL